MDIKDMLKIRYLLEYGLNKDIHIQSGPLEWWIVILFFMIVKLNIFIKLNRMELIKLEYQNIKMEN